MDHPEPTPERVARRAARRRALLGLVRSVRALITGAVSTNVAPGEVEKIDAEVAGLASRLQAEVHRGPYSGLLGPNAADRYEPSQSVPLSPWAGKFNPIAPPVELQFHEGRVSGRVELGKQYIGPPGVAHGGVVAGIMDQLLASAGQSAGVAGVTATMTVHFRKPTPLFAELRLEAWADPRDDGSKKRKVHARILYGEQVTAEAEALVIRSKRLTNPDATSGGGEP